MKKSSLSYHIVPVTAFQQNCSIVWCSETKEAIVIDAGGEAEKIKAVIKQLGLNIKAMLLTHGHLDHAGAARVLAEEYNVKVIGPHKGDAFWLDGMEQQAAMYGFPAVKSFHPDKWLKDGDSYTFGHCTLAVYHCPGHTPGHVVFIEHQAEKAFVGDVLFKGSIGRTDFPKGNHGDLIDSIRSLLPMGDDISFVPGHGPESTFGYEKRTNPFLN